MLGIKRRDFVTVLGGPGGMARYGTRAADLKQRSSRRLPDLGTDLVRREVANLT